MISVAGECAGSNQKGTREVLQCIACRGGSSSLAPPCGSRSSAQSISHGAKQKQHRPSARCQLRRCSTRSRDAVAARKTEKKSAEAASRGGRGIAAMHAREFKRLVKAHGIADETIEGVKIVGSAR